MSNKNLSVCFISVSLSKALFYVFCYGFDPLFTCPLTPIFDDLFAILYNIGVQNIPSFAYEINLFSRLTSGVIMVMMNTCVLFCVRRFSLTSLMVQPAMYFSYNQVAKFEVAEIPGNNTRFLGYATIEKDLL